MAKNQNHTGAGPSQRQLRVGELIRRTLSEILVRGETHDTDLNRMSVTVSEVRVSPDLRIATAYVLPLGGDNLDEALEALDRNKSELRRALSKAVRLRFAPELNFVIDDTFDRLDATRELFARDDVRRDLEDED